MTARGAGRVVLRGGTVVAGPDDAPRLADVAVEDGAITEVGTIAHRPGDDVVDCSARHVVPGLIDTHSHADGTIFDPAVQTANLRQGVTTVIVGQDGVSFAPGDGAYGDDYFGALNGHHPTYRGGGVAALLASYDRAVPVNVGYLVPAGTVRYEAMGRGAATPTAAELEQMVAAVATGMDEGALGLSTGLDYIPGLFASTTEIAALCAAVAARDGLHVSHMRGGYESNAAAGIEELVQIARASGVRTHVSHLHGPAELIRSLVDEASARIPLTFDMYPYRRGCTLLAMLLLPPELLERPRRDVTADLHDAERRSGLVAAIGERLAARADMGTEWSARTTIASAGSPDYGWMPGLTIDEGSRRVGQDPLEFAVDMLVAGELDVTAVVETPGARSVDELSRVLSHPLHTVGSDGIYVGEHPHPRGWGSMARIFSRHVRERGDLGVTDAVGHCSTRAADVFRLGRRGRIRPGWVADLAVMDLDAVQDRADYTHPRRDAAGVDDVLVGGIVVLRGGEPTDRAPGRGLHRQRRQRGEGV